MMPIRRLSLVLREIHDANGRAEASDRDLLECFATKKDESAFAALMRRHGSMVLGLCRRMLGHEQDAEDAFQATFLVLARRAGSVRWQNSVAHWLHETACRISRHSRAAALARRSGQKAFENSTQPESMSVVSCRTISSMLDDELRQLPEKLREPMVLCYLEGQAQAVAAARLGYSEATLNRRLAEGRDQLRRRLERRGITLTAALLALGLSEDARAAVPAMLTKSTLNLVMAEVAGQMLMEASTNVLGLAAGAIHALTNAKVKLGIVLLLTTSLLAGGMILAFRNSRARQVGEKQADGARQSEEILPQPSSEKRREDEDALPAGALARLGTLRLRQEGPVRSLAFLPDGKTLAAGSNSLVFWDSASGKAVHRFNGDVPVGALVCSGDGKTVLCWMGSLRLLDSTTGKELLRIKNEFTQEEFYAVALAADGKIAATATRKNGSRRGRERDQGLIQLWDMATGTRIAEWSSTSRASHMTFSPDGKLLAVAVTDLPGANRSIELRDVATGDVLRELKGNDLPSAAERQMAFSPDGKFLAAAAPANVVILWDTKTGFEIRKLEGHAGPVTALAYSPTGAAIATACLEDHKVRLWDPETGKLLREWHGDANTLTFSPKGTLLAAGSPEVEGSSTVVQLDTATGLEFGPAAWHSAPLQTASCSANGRLVATVGSDGVMRLWDAERARQIHAFDADAAQVALSSDGKQVLAVAPNGTVRSWDTTSYQELRKFETQIEEPVRQRSFSANGKFLIIVGQNAELALWNTTTGKLVHSFKNVDGPVLGATLSFDGNWLAVGSGNGNLRLLDVTTGKQREWKKKRDVILDVPPANLAFAWSGDYLVARSAEGVRVYELASGEMVDEIKAPSGNLSGPALRGKTGIMVQIRGDRLGPQAGGTVVSALSPDGRVLAFATGSAVRLIDLATSSELGVLAGHQSRVNSLAFSADGTRLVSVSADTTGLIWDVNHWLPKPQGVELSRRDVIEIWDRLGDDDEAVAYKAMWALTDLAPASYALLRDRLRPAMDSGDGKKLSKLIAQLDSEDLEKRTQAYEDLAEAGASTESACRRALKAGPSLEARVQLEKLLARADRMTGERLQQLRALAALERSSNPEARELLRSLASGEDGAWLTELAKIALDRQR
jgi:RNA polymerase sigma factor (sigma-70 family)